MKFISPNLKQKNKYTAVSFQICRQAGLKLFEFGKCWFITESYRDKVFSQRTAKRSVFLRVLCAIFTLRSLREPVLGFFFLFYLALALSSCHGDYTPKPKAYPRIIFPEKKYDLYDPVECPFKFEIPVYANVSPDTIFFGEHIVSNLCWLNVNFPAFNGTINLTYKEINPKQTLEKLIEDAHKLSFKHTEKADYINEIRIENDHGAGGILYDVGGDAASNVQFFLTDSTRHFIRGALYFNNEPNTDSMGPIVNFVRADMNRMLRTFEWK